jgi:CHAT domain-containing protein
VRRLIERAEQARCERAILSACETGRVEASDALNDALGLSGALLAAGCGGVMATFWPVRDLAACLVLDRTLEIWNTERGPLPTVLAAATRWLREATADSLVERLNLWERDHPDYAPLLDDYIGRLATYQRRPPFEDEINWAPFHLVGNPELPRRA